MSDIKNLWPAVKVSYLVSKTNIFTASLNTISWSPLCSLSGASLQVSASYRWINMDQSPVDAETTRCFFPFLWNNKVCSGLSAVCLVSHNRKSVDRLLNIWGRIGNVIGCGAWGWLKTRLAQNDWCLTPSATKAISRQRSRPCKQVLLDKKERCSPDEIWTQEHPIRTAFVTNA